MLETPQIMDIAVNFKPILRHLPENGILSPILLTGNSQSSRNFLNGRDEIVESVGRTSSSGIVTSNISPTADIPTISPPDINLPNSLETQSPQGNPFQLQPGESIGDWQRRTGIFLKDVDISETPWGKWNQQRIERRNREFQERQRTGDWIILDN